MAANAEKTDLVWSLSQWANIFCLTFQMSNFAKFDENIKYQLDCLEHQLGADCPMRPMKGFRLDFSTILALFGLTTTYTIILLQFKMDES